MTGHLTIGTLVAFQSLLMSFSAPVQQIVGIGGRVQQVSADLARLDDVLHYRRDWRFSQAADRASRGTGGAGQLSTARTSASATARSSRR